MDPALEIANLFFIPSGLFLAALGSARTEPLKAAVSAMGTIVAILWIFSLWDVAGHSGNFAKAVRTAPYIFLALWVCSTVVHVRLWIRPPSAQGTAAAASK